MSHLASEYFTYPQKPNEDCFFPPRLRLSSCLVQARPRYLSTLPYHLRTQCPHTRRLDNCGSGGCQSSPAELTILCGDGTTAAGSVTPAPVSVTASNCPVIEVAGTTGASNDGFYYDDRSDLGDDVTQFKGYEYVAGELTRCIFSLLALTLLFTGGPM